MNTTLIAINGFKRSGKGETGKAIASLGWDRMVPVTTLGFADKLKVAACRALGMLTLPEAQCIEYMDHFKEAGVIQYGTMPWARSSANTNISGRQYLQWMGTEFRKLFGDDFWVDQVLPKPTPCVAVAAQPYKAAANIDQVNLKNMYGEGIVAFTDTRFPNEAKRVLDLGGEVWEIVHPATESDGHESEIRLPASLITRRIVNDGSLMDLRYKVEQALNF